MDPLRKTNYHYKQSQPPSKKKPPSAEKAVTALKKVQSPLNVLGNFLASTQLPGEMKIVASKVREAVVAFFETIVRPFAARASAEPQEITQAKGLFSAHMLTGVATVIGAAASIFNLVKAGKMIKKGIRLANKKMQATRSHFEYGRSMIRKGAREVALHSAGLLGSAVGLMQSASQLTALIQPAAFATVTSILQVGTIIGAPITLCLSAYGTKVNVDRIRSSSAQLLLLRQERERLNDIKRQMHITHFTDETVKIDGSPVNLKEREEIVRFALRKAGDRRVTNIAGLVSNSLFMAASVLSVGALATGPGAAVMGTIALVCVAVGGLGMLLTRAILAAIGAHRKAKMKRELGEGLTTTTYISSKQMLAKTKEILSTEQKTPYREKQEMSSMSNGELLTFLIRGSSTRLSPQEMRGAFLVGPNHYWSKAFA